YHFICVVWSVLLPCSRGLVYPSTSAGCSLASFDIEQRKLYSFRSWRLTVFTINNVLCSRQLQKLHSEKLVQYARACQRSGLSNFLLITLFRYHFLEKTSEEVCRMEINVLNHCCHILMQHSLISFLFAIRALFIERMSELLRAVSVKAMSLNYPTRNFAWLRSFSSVSL
uniref:Secreted protein n=1 Tax=Parascaris univalens TaxID=6257 RepID=A0A915A355_PARUN